MDEELFGRRIARDVVIRRGEVGHLIQTGALRRTRSPALDGELRFGRLALCVTTRDLWARGLKLF